MAGRGPAPKPASRRVRRTTDPVPTVTLQLVRARQPALPKDTDWHPRTRAWWRAWSRSELAKDFTESDWSFLLDTALLQNAIWAKGMFQLAGEVRLRVAKYGATPEDRARLRIVFADADEKDNARSAHSGGSSRARYKGLRAVAGGTVDAVPTD